MIFTFASFSLAILTLPDSLLSQMSVKVQQGIGVIAGIP